MNKELLNDNINEILEGLKTVIHTANAELPAIFDEIVRWGMIKYSVSTIITLVFMLLFGGLTIYIYKTYKGDAGDAMVFMGFTAFLFLVFFIGFLMKLLFIYTSPKLYIIDYLKDLI